MIVSRPQIVILSLIVNWVFRKMTIPGLIGMLFLGVVFGGYAVGWVSPNLLEISADFRRIAL